MKETTGCIFLSHASFDKDYVEEIVSRLPSSHIFYDTQSISPGDTNIAALETALEAADVFVLFVSPTSLERPYVKYEAELAKVQKIKRDYLKIFIVPIKGAKYSDAPEWMHQYQATDEKFSTGDISRLIWNGYLEVLYKKGALEQKVLVGREALSRKIILDYRSKLREAVLPNFIYFAGIEQMGRSALAASLISHLYPQSSINPAIFELKPSADSIDLYLALMEDIAGPQPKERLAKIISEFSQLDSEQQASKIYEKLKHFGKINQIVLIKSAMGLRDQSRSPKEWVGHLLQRLEHDTDVKLMWVTERRLPIETMQHYRNLIEVEVPPLEDMDIEYLLESIIQDDAYKAYNLQSLAKKINGHSGTAYFVAMLLNSNAVSPEALLEDDTVISSYQDKLVSKAIKGFDSSSIEFNILYFLSILPYCDYHTLKMLINGSGDKKPSEMNDALAILTESCLIKYSLNSGYSAPNIVKSSFLYGLEEHPEKLVNSLKAVIGNGIKDDRTKISQLEVLIYIHSFLGSEIPDGLKDLITPASLEEIVVQNYKNGLSTKEISEAINFYKNAAKYAEFSDHINTSDDTREAILQTGAEALVRLGQDPKKFTDKMKKHGYLARHFITGSHAFHNLHNYDLAAAELKIAFDANVFKKRSARMLTKAYLALRSPEQAMAIFDKLDSRIVERDSGLLGTKIKALRALNREDEARQLEDMLKTVPDDFGTIELNTITAALRGRVRLEDAIKACDSYLEKSKSNKLNGKILQAAIRIEMGQAEEAAEGINLAKTTGRFNDYYGLLARKSLKEGRTEEAYGFYKKIQSPNLYDKLVFLEICKSLENLGTSLNKKEIEEEKNAVLITMRKEPDEFIRIGKVG